MYAKSISLHISNRTRRTKWLSRVKACRWLCCLNKRSRGKLAALSDKEDTKKPATFDNMAFEGPVPEHVKQQLASAARVSVLG